MIMYQLCRSKFVLGRFSSWKLLNSFGARYCSNSDMSSHHLEKDSPLPPAAEHQMRLYSMRFCPFVQRTKLVLEYKNIPHEVVYVNLRNKPDWLFERNPTGRVPILEYKGHVIYESAVCNEYLEEAFPASPKHGPALLPSCPFERASARLLMLSFNKVTGYIFRFNFNSDPAMHQELRNSFHTDLQKFENLLAASKKPFFGGTNCGMADFHLWPFFERFDAISELSGNDILPAAKFPQLTAWKSLMETLDAVKKTQLSTAAHKHFLVTYRGGNPDYDFDVEKIGHGLPEAAHKVSKL